MAEIKDFSENFINNLLKGDFIDYGLVKGTIIFRQYSYRIWEKIQSIVDREIKKIGVQNTYFPLFIPEGYLKKEKEHLEGFSPEVAVVTFAGGEELEEKLIVRPTSETIIYPYFAKWIKSYRDLPMMINQWVNVIRWEKRPFPFLRNTEFLWQEGHTAHSTNKEADNFALKILSLYEKIYNDVFCLYGIKGRKSKLEKFAGALKTYTYEILMPDKKALQACTSHNLGQNFSKVFDVKFQDKDKKLKFVWQTSWAITTRSIGALLAVHSDEKGFIIPPKLSPYQIVIIPIFDKKNDRKIKKFCQNLKDEIKFFDVYLDLRDKTPGYKFNDWELKGVPLRIEIGNKEIKENKLTIFRRDKKEKFNLSLDNLKNNLENIFQEIERNLFQRSKEFTQKNTHQVFSYQEFKKIIETKGGFILAPFCENENCEIKIKEETKATTRCLPLDFKKQKGLKCIYCQKKVNDIWLFAKSY